MSEPVYVRETKNWKGVFAAIGIKKGEVILEWHGVLVHGYEQAITEFGKDDWDHMVQIGRELYLDPDGPPGRLVNHSCDPMVM